MSEIEFDEDEGSPTPSILEDFVFDDFDDLNGDALLESLEYQYEACPNSGPSSSKKRKRPPLVTCHFCKRGFYSMEGYKNHLKLHLTADYFLSAPGYEAVQGHSRIASREILSSYATCSLFKGGFCGEVIEMAEDLLQAPEESLWIFVEFIVDLIWGCFPTSTLKLAGFYRYFTKAVGNIASDTDVRSRAVYLVKEVLGIVNSQDKDRAIKFLIGDFVMKMGSSIQAFYLKSIREHQALKLFGDQDQSEVAASSRDNIEDSHVQGSIYYIGGSSVRTVLKKGLAATSSPVWKKIVTCVMDRFIAGPLAEAPDSEVRRWTESCDRGGLIHISDSAWSFLLVLSQVLVKLEKPDGSLLHTEIYEYVKNDGILYGHLWCELVGEKLNQDESDFLLQHVCEAFTKTWARGIVLRRTNAMKGKSRDKRSLRTSLL